jgi:H+/Cl- antiporter ClcA
MLSSRKLLHIYHRHLHPRRWRDRLVIWVAAVATGLTVVGFVKLTDAANSSFAAIRDSWPWLPLVMTPAGGALVVWLTTRFAPGAAGSGIPQVIAALNTELPPEGVRHLVSLRLTFNKMWLAAAAMYAGFATGREGPSVQIAAGMLGSCHRWLLHKSALKQRDLILAGGAAGIAAAFNAPLAGVVFAIEELSKRFEERSSGVLITAIVIAGLVAISVMGNLTYFGRVESTAVTADFFWPGMVVKLAAALCGGLFSRLLLFSFQDRTSPLSRWRGRYPIRFAAACGAVVAVLGLLSGGAAHGSGYTTSQQLLSGSGPVSPSYFVVKFVATWVSFWSGVPGGVFAPALAIGAGIGHDIALLFSSASPEPLIAIGMAGFLAAVTQAPITSFIIVMEMTDGHSMVLSLMASALLASIISRFIGEPLYPALARLQIKRVENLLTRDQL